MSRAIVGAALLLSAWATTAGAQEETQISDAVACLNGVGCTSHPELLSGLTDAAAEAGTNPVDVLAALNTLADAGIETTAREYLASDGLIAASIKVAPRGGSAVEDRVACLERKESGGANVSNRTGSGAGGVMQYMASTFARGAVEIGHPEYSRWVPWQARIVAAHDLLMGRRSQWTVSGCGA